MKAKLSIIMILITVILAGCNVAESKPASASVNIYSDFNRFIHSLDNKTAAQNDEAWASTLKGKQVRWSGAVYDAFKDSIDKTTKVVIVHMGGANFVKVTLAAGDPLDVLTLNKGDKISFEGTLSEQGGTVKSWVVTDAKIVK